MEKHEVVWSTRAIGQRFIISEWYKNKLGEIASTHFNNDLNNTIDAISAMPTIGTYSDKFSSNKYQYYTIPIHKKYILIYRYTSKIVYILAIRSTLMM